MIPALNPIFRLRFIARLTQCCRIKTSAEFFVCKVFVHGVDPLMVILVGRRKGGIPRHIQGQGRWRNR